MTSEARGRLLFFGMLVATEAVVLAAGVREYRGGRPQGIVVLPLLMMIFFFYMRRGQLWARGLLVFWYAVMAVGSVIALIRAPGSGWLPLIRPALLAGSILFALALIASKDLKAYLESEDGSSRGEPGTPAADSP